MTSYIALIHKEQTTDYGVSFPDFPGCVTAGKSLEDAQAMAGEALSLHIDGMLEDGETIPSPSPLSSIMQDRQNLNAVAFLVPAITSSQKVVRVNITIREGDLQQIDAFADRHKMTRSGFLIQAAQTAIADERRKTGRG
jgi:predicted RNase H-like HicB family nuclease